MVAKSMIPQKFCQGCNQEHDCQEIYQKLSNLKGPSVVLKAVVAFLLPISVFIITLAIFEKILSGFEITADLRTVFSVAASLLVTVVFVLIIDRIHRIKPDIFKKTGQSC